MDEPLTYTEHFRQFLAERPAISPNRLADELGFDKANLQKIMQGERNIPQPKRGDFRHIMLKYGYTDLPLQNC
ncbi:MAG: hypothetical protein GC192_10725 [Bacteroidetes bacterium]|nr:hypothetical protein [Bacteroidota bacterium]